MSPRAIKRALRTDEQADQSQALPGWYTSVFSPTMERMVEAAAAGDKKKARSLAEDLGRDTEQQPGARLSS